jgi:hypothetical protein
MMFFNLLFFQNIKIGLLNLFWRVVAYSKLLLDDINGLMPLMTSPEESSMRV